MKTNENNISSYIHCGLCFDEWNNDPIISQNMSPAQYQKIQAGWTKKGLQIWCNRHDCNIIHIDFEGHKHTADTTRLG